MSNTVQVRLTTGEVLDGVEALTYANGLSDIFVGDTGRGSGYVRAWYSRQDQLWVAT